MTDGLYCNELTDTDRNLGFQVKPTKNPRGEYAYSPEKVPAAVLTLTSTDRIIKINNPVAGAATYHLQRFGHYRDQKPERADWQVISGTAYPTAEEAMLAYEHDLPGLVGRQTGWPQPELVPIEPGERY